MLNYEHSELTRLKDLRLRGTPFARFLLIDRASHICILEFHFAEFMENMDFFGNYCRCVKDGRSYRQGTWVKYIYV